MEKKSSPVLPTILWFVFTGIYLVYLYFGFFVEADCSGIDKIDPWCKFHPFTGADIFALICGLGGIVYQCWFWIFRRDGLEDSGFKNALGTILVIIAIILSWVA
jgi:hypothetical protein